MDPKGIARVCDLVAPPIEACPIQTKVCRGPGFIVDTTLFRGEFILKDKAVGVVARLCSICFVAIGVELVVFGYSGGLTRNQPFYQQSRVCEG